MDICLKAVFNVLEVGSGRVFISAVGCLPEAVALQHDELGPEDREHEDTCSSLWPVTLLSLILTASDLYVNPCLQVELGILIPFTLGRWSGSPPDG